MDFNVMLLCFVLMVSSVYAGEFKVLLPLSVDLKCKPDEAIQVTHALVTQVGFLPLKKNVISTFQKECNFRSSCTVQTLRFASKTGWDVGGYGIKIDIKYCIAVRWQCNVITPSCGGNLNSMVGTISVHGKDFPRINQRPSTQCNWKVYIPNKLPVKIAFSKFNFVSLPCISSAVTISVGGKTKYFLCSDILPNGKDFTIDGGMFEVAINMETKLWKDDTGFTMHYYPTSFFALVKD